MIPAQSRGWRARLPSEKSSPTSQPNSARTPTLIARLATGAPLKKGEKSLSMGMT